MVLTLVVFTLVGTALGVIGAAIRQPGFALGATLAGFHGLNGLSIASKELELSTLGFALTIAAFTLVGIGLLILSLTRAPARGRPLGTALPALAAVPGGTLLWDWLPEGWPALALVALLPLALLWLGLRLDPPRLVSALAAGALVLPVALEPAPLRARPTDSPTGTPPADAPSVVLIVIDTLRSDRVDPGGDGALARLAREGVFCEQAISVAPWTLPAMGSLMTGLYPSQHGAVSARVPLPTELTTLAERFHESGYTTAAFTGGAFVGPAHRLDQGFEIFDSEVERSFPAFRTYVPLLWRVAKNKFAPQRWIVRAVGEYRGLAGALEAVRSWQPPRERPFFLFVHSYQVHDYYLYDPRTDDPVVRTRGLPPRFAKRLSVHPEELGQASVDELDWFRAIYDARLADVDRTLGELLELVRSKAADRELVIALTSDHGEGFDAASRRVHHGGRLHDDLLHVPLVLQAPSLSPRRVPDQISTLDLAPTLLELAGLAPLQGIAGRSRLEALRGEGSFAASAFAEEWEHARELLCLRRPGWKWIRKPGTDEVYALDRDGAELRNLETGPEELAEELEAFRKGHPLRSEGEAELDAATQKHLQDLGYTGGSEDE